VEPNLSGLDDKSLIFVSHEHPDHLNFPTLKNYFDQQTVLIRSDIRDAVVSAIEASGKKVNRIDKHVRYPLGHAGDHIVIFTVGSDSALYCKDGITGESLFNFNDCEFTDEQLRQISNALGESVDLVCGQFGLAGYYANNEDKQVFRDAWTIKLNRFRAAMKYFSPKLVLPFASFARFCKIGNKHINYHQPKLLDVVNALSGPDNPEVSVWIPYPNEQIMLSRIASFANLSGEDRQNFWDQAIRGYKGDPYDDERTSIDEIIQEIHTFQRKVGHLAHLLPSPQAVFITVKSKGQASKISFHPFRQDLVGLHEGATHFEIPSDELIFALRHHWGPDTLNITGSARVFSRPGYSYFLQVTTQLLARI
jgi:hypothetical protein